MNPRFEAGIPDFMNGILHFSIHFNVVHRKVDWRNPKMKSLNSMPGKCSFLFENRCGFQITFTYSSPIITHEEEPLGGVAGGWTEEGFNTSQQRAQRNVLGGSLHHFTRA